MKKSLTVLMMVLLAATFIISCENSVSTPEDKGSSTTTYTVTFDVDGNTTAIQAQTVESGKTAAEPEDPKKTNAVFRFWSKDGSEEFKFDTPITENITLKAVWKTTFAVGDTGPAGGKIFYVNENYDASSTDETKNWKYLEAAAEDLSTTNGNTFVFGYYYASEYKQVLSTGNTAVGTGKKNTKALVEAMGTIARSSDAGTTTTDQYAAIICSTYRGGGYSDWFLPSQDELKVMYDKKADIGGFSDARYWSSTESSVNYAVYYDFSSDTNAKGDNTRANAYRVRPIRAFAEAGSSSGSSTPTTTYTVTFEFNNTEGGSDTRTVVSGEKITRPSDPVYSGHYLASWNKPDGSKFNFTTDTITGDIILTAQWIGDTLTYGTYPDNYAISDLRNRSITWKVLSVDADNSRVLVISKDILIEKKEFDSGNKTSTNYSGSDIQSYLKGDFITAYGLTNVNMCNVDVTTETTTFVNTESDKVFLLSETEAKEYFSDNASRIANYNGTADQWWLRTVVSNYSIYTVTNKGAFDSYSSPNYDRGVRPAFWVNL